MKFWLRFFSSSCSIVQVPTENLYHLRRIDLDACIAQKDSLKTPEDRENLETAVEEAKQFIENLESKFGPSWQFTNEKRILDVGDGDSIRSSDSSCESQSLIQLDDKDSIELSSGSSEPIANSLAFQINSLTCDEKNPPERISPQAKDCIGVCLPSESQQELPTNDRGDVLDEKRDPVIPTRVDSSLKLLETDSNDRCSQKELKSSAGQDGTNKRKRKTVGFCINCEIFRFEAREECSRRESLERSIELVKGVLDESVIKFRAVVKHCQEFNKRIKLN